MNTSQLDCFLAVADELNFARAAEQLHITQPAVTHQIQSLETELNAKLFHRTTRTVELTRAGFAFINDAKDILGRTRAAKARISSQSPGHISEFFIGCLNFHEQNLLPPVLQSLVIEFPLLHPVIKQGPFLLMQNQLREESLHVMFGFDEKTEPDNRLADDDPLFTTQKTGVFTLLANAPVSCIVSPKHPLAAKVSLTFQDLKKESILACEPRHTSPAITAATAPLVGRYSMENVYFCDNMTSIYTLAKAGLGFSLVPDIPLLRDPALCYIPVENTAPMRFGLFYKNRGTHPALKRFVELMQNQFQ